MFFLRRAIKASAVKIAAVFGVLLCSAPSGALGSSPYDGTRVAPFLYIPIGARQSISPGVLTSLRPDPSLIFSNPAPVAGMNGGEIFISSANWLDNVALSAVGLVAPFAPAGFRFGLGARFLYSGGLKGYSETLQLVKEAHYYDLSLNFSASRKMPVTGLSAGVGISYIRENLGDRTGGGPALTLGTVYKKGTNILELSAKNLGGKLTFKDGTFEIDHSVSAGYGKLLSRGWGIIELGGELEIFSSGNRRFSFGADYLINRFVSLRLGSSHYFSGSETSEFPLSAGLDVNYGTVSLSYAFVPRDYFADTHTFSLSFSFGRPGDAMDISPDGLIQTPPAGNNNPSSSVKKSSPPMVSGKSAAAQTLKSKKPLKTDAGKKVVKNKKTVYLVVAGKHSRQASAEAEIQAFKHMDIPAVIKRIGPRFMVCIGVFATRKEAEKVIKKYKSQGYSFDLLKQAP